MLPIKQVENNYGYTGSYKETNCLTAYGEYKSTLKDSEPGEEKPDAVKCAYDKYKYKSTDEEQDRMRKSAHKGIIADFCENSTTACNIEDENGNPVEPDEMCMDLNVCDQGMTLFEIIPLALEFFKIFQVLLKDISPEEAKKLLGRKNSRVTEFKKKQAQLKLVEMEAIKNKYNDVIKSEKDNYIKSHEETRALIEGENASNSQENSESSNILSDNQTGTESETQQPGENDKPDENAKTASDPAGGTADATGEPATVAAEDTAPANGESATVAAEANAGDKATAGERSDGEAKANDAVDGANSEAKTAAGEANATVTGDGVSATAAAEANAGDKATTGDTGESSDGEANAVASRTVTLGKAPGGEAGEDGTVAGGGYKILVGGADQVQELEQGKNNGPEPGDPLRESNNKSQNVVCVPKKPSEEHRERCAALKEKEKCIKEPVCMIEDKNPILDEDWKKYKFETALEAYKEYILFKKVCSDTEIIRKIIKQYEDKMTMDLTTDINERETYKDSNQLLKILEEYEKQSAQSKELQTSGTFSKLTKGVKNFSDKALETDRVRKKCANIDLTGAVGNMVEGAFNVVTAPVTGIAKIAETENKNAVDDEKTNTTEAVKPKNTTNASNETEKKTPSQGGSRTQKRKNYRIYNRKYTVKRRKKTIKNKK